MNPGIPTPTAAPDHDLIRAVASGDHAALQTLMDNWKKPLFAFCYRSTGNQQTAEDLVMETFVRLYRSADRYDPRAPFKAWIFRIARNLVQNEWRRQSRKPAVPVESSDLEFLAGAGGDHRSSQETKETLDLALQSLPEKYRTALLLVIQQEMSNEEAARTMGILPTHFRVLLYRARKSLKQKMEEIDEPKKI